MEDRARGRAETLVTSTPLEERHIRMPTFGYFLSCEEYSPQEILDQARLAEEAGFDALWSATTTTPGRAPMARARSSGR